MGVFFTAPKAVAPAIKSAIREALAQDPKSFTASLETEASARTQELAQATAPQFNLRNFLLAVAISAALLTVAICTATPHPDISKALMTSFTSFSGIALGLLGGEAQKSSS